MMSACHEAIRVLRRCYPSIQIAGLCTLGMSPSDGVPYQTPQKTNDRNSYVERPDIASPPAGTFEDDTDYAFCSARDNLAETFLCQE